jgi:hypothetical protein
MIDRNDAKLNQKYSPQISYETEHLNTNIPLLHVLVIQLHFLVIGTFPRFSVLGLTLAASTRPALTGTDTLSRDAFFGRPALFRRFRRSFLGCR